MASTKSQCPVSSIESGSRRKKHQTRRNTIYTMASMASLLLLPVSAQIGTSVCVCSPSEYEMTFNFSSTCDSTFVEGPGVITTDCAISPFQDENVSDLIPVSIGSVDVLELDGDLTLMTQSSKFGTYLDGDSTGYTSIANDALNVNATNYPKALQVSVIGANEAGEALFFAGLIIYSTDCNTFPVLLEGSSIGWISFTSLTDPIPEVCPRAGTRSPISTIAPTQAPIRVLPVMTNSPSPLPSTLSPQSMATRSPLAEKPTCYGNDHSSSSNSSSKSSGKGKGKGGKDGKGGKGSGESGKGKGKKSKKSSSKSSGSSGKGKRKGKGYSNIFDHDECSDSAKSSSNSDSSDGLDPPTQPPPTTTPPAVTATAAPTQAPSKGSITVSGFSASSASSGDGSDDNADTGATSGDASSGDLQQRVASSFKNSAHAWNLKTSISEKEPEPATKGEFFGSVGYYGMLFCLSALAIVGAAWSWKRPHPVNAMAQQTTLVARLTKDLSGQYT